MKKKTSFAKPILLPHRAWKRWKKQLFRLSLSRCYVFFLSCVSYFAARKAKHKVNSVKQNLFSFIFFFSYVFRHFPFTQTHKLDRHWLLNVMSSTKKNSNNNNWRNSKKNARYDNFPYYDCIISEAVMFFFRSFAPFHKTWGFCARIWCSFLLHSFCYSSNLKSLCANLFLFTIAGQQI